MSTNAVIIGGTSGLGLKVARVLADRGEQVVITGREGGRSQAVAAEIGSTAKGIGVDLAHPEGIQKALANVEQVHHLVIAAIERDENNIRDYDIARAVRLTTMKLVGYMEVIHTLHERLASDASIVLFGGLAKEKPYPGSTTVTIVNGGIATMVRTLATELAPIRVNAIHPGVISDSPAWTGKDQRFLNA